MSKGWPACFTNNNLTLATPQTCLVAFCSDLVYCPVGMLETYSTNQHGIDTILTTFVTKKVMRMTSYSVATASVMLVIGVGGKGAMGMLVNDFFVIRSPTQLFGTVSVQFGHPFHIVSQQPF